MKQSLRPSRLICQHAPNLLWAGAEQGVQVLGSGPVLSPPRLLIRPPLLPTSQPPQTWATLHTQQVLQFCYNVDEEKKLISARATVYVEFTCSPHLCVGFLHVFQFPSISQRLVKRRWLLEVEDIKVAWRRRGSLDKWDQVHHRLIDINMS